MVYRTKLLYLRRIILFATKYILQCFYKIILFVKRSIERALLDTYLNRIIQKVCRRRHMKRARKKAHNADGPGGDGDDVNNGLMVVTIW